MLNSLLKRPLPSVENCEGALLNAAFRSRMSVPFTVPGASSVNSIALPEKIGGSGHGFVELALLLAEVGWSVAPVPVYATLLLGADTIARYGDDGQRQTHRQPDHAEQGVLTFVVQPALHPEARQEEHPPDQRRHCVAESDAGVETPA